LAPRSTFKNPTKPRTKKKKKNPLLYSKNGTEKQEKPGSKADI
jgi:hypothetical protein